MAAQVIEKSAHGADGRRCEVCGKLVSQSESSHFELRNVLHPESLYEEGGRRFFCSDEHLRRWVAQGVTGG